MTVPSPEVTVGTGFLLGEAISLGSPANVSCIIKVANISDYGDVLIQGNLVLGTKHTEKEFTYKVNPAIAMTYTFNHTITNVDVNDSGIYNCTAALVYNGSNDFILNSNTISSSSSLYIHSKLY